MNKKILAVSILAVLTLITISFASAINTTPAKKKESPLFGIRTRLAIRERLDKLKDDIKAKFVGERVFFLPFQWLRNKMYEDSMYSILTPTCSSLPCTFEKGVNTCDPRFCTPTASYTCVFPC